MDARKRQRLLTVLALVCFGALAGDKLVFSPLLKLYKKRSERIADLEQKLTEGRALVDREEMMKARWEDMKQESLPTAQSVAENEVLQSMSRWSRDSRLGIDSRKPRWVEDEEDHKKLEFRVTAQGSMASVARFLYEIDRDPLALSVEDVDIVARDDGGRNLTLSVRFTGLLLTGEEL